MIEIKYKKCLNCSNLFTRLTSKKTFDTFHFNKKKYCSRACKSLNQSPETRKKLSKIHLGNKNHNYKHGESPNQIGYRSLHKWVERQLGKPSFCEQCKDVTLKHRQYHWANISNKYKRDTNDWQRLCAKCHKKYDKNNK